MIGKHYSRNEYNCAHFVADYYREKLNVEIPVINEFDISFMRWMRQNFVKSDNPVEHCLVLMVEHKQSHIGIYADSGVYHNYKPSNALGSVVHTQLGAIKRNYSQVSYWIMVNIIYMNDINDSKVDAVEYPCISDFLIENFNTRDELLDLRFFRDELLGTEINQAGGDFIDIDEGTVVVVHDSQIPKGPETWIYIIIAVTVAVATAIALKPDLPDLKNSSQKSATNRLGDTSNEPRINERIDDIFGTVSKHVVSLWQVPYRIGVNNQETEVLYTCVGRGKYAISADDWFDGDTPVKNIPNASVNVYGPNTHPSNGSPSLQIGGLINQPIGIYRQSNDLNPSELLPSNENLNRYIYWKATVNPVSPDIVVLTHVGPLPEGVNLLDIYTIGNYTNATDFVWTTQTGTLQLYLNNTGTPAKIIKLFSIPLDLSEDNTLNYEILDVTTSSVTLLVPSDASLDTKAAWASMNNYEFTKYMFKLTSSKPSSYWTDDGETDYYTYYEKDSSDTYFPIDSEQVFTDFVLGQDVQFEIGPLVVPENATEVILNFTSPSGFYKLVDNNETKIVANIRIKFVETDSNGVETGNENITDIEYKSNPDSIRRSVFKTARLNVPYTYCKLSCERTTIRDKSNNVSSVDIIEWRDFYSFEPVNVTSFGDVTTAHILIPSNSQSRLVKQRKQNVTLTRLITEYLGNGNFGSTQTFATDRFDQILIYAALDPYIGRLTLNDINAEGFLSLRTEIENYFGSNIMTKFG